MSYKRPTLNIAFFVNWFPLLSETFILNQVTGLLDRGHNVEIYVNRIGTEPLVHRDIEKYNLLNRTFCHGSRWPNMPHNKIARFAKCLHLIAGSINRKPLPLFKSMNILKFGWKAASLHLFYDAYTFFDKAHGYDIVHCHFGPNGILGVLLKDVCALRGKVITTFHGYDLTSYLESRGNRVYETLFKKGDLFLPISNRWKEKLIRLGCAEEKILVHRMGIEASRFSYSPNKPQKNDKIALLTVARLVEKKGVEYGIQALVNVIRIFPNVEYSIAGDGPLKKDLIDLITKLEISNNVKLLGWKTQDEISYLMDQADILLAPSVTGEDGDQEGIPVVLMEAMARGLPVISTFHSGIPELIIDGKTGSLVPERDVDVLAEKIKHLIIHPEVRERMRQEARQYTEKNYDINKLNDKLVEIYIQLINS